MCLFCTGLSCTQADSWLIYFIQVMAASLTFALAQTVQLLGHLRAWWPRKPHQGTHRLRDQPFAAHSPFPVAQPNLETPWAQKTRYEGDSAGSLRPHCRRGDL